jgi:hypothetical protein
MTLFTTAQRHKSYRVGTNSLLDRYLLFEGLTVGSHMIKKECMIPQLLVVNME